MVNSSDENHTDAVRSFRSLHFYEYLYLAFLAALPIAHPLRVIFSGLSVQACDFLFAGAAVVWAIGIFRGKVKIRRSWFYLPLALYLAAMVFSTIYSINPQQSATKLVGKVYLVFIAILTFNLVNSLSFMRRASEVWQVGTVLTVAFTILGILLFFVGLKDRSINFMLSPYGTLPPGPYPRVDGLFEYAALLGNFLSISFVIALIMSSAGWLNGRWLWALIVGICVVAVFTFTPGIGGLALSAGLWLWLHLKRIGHTFLSKLSLVTGIGIAVSFLMAASLTLFSYGEGFTPIPIAHKQFKPSSRVAIWQAAFETFKEYPLFGRGVGMEVFPTTIIVPSGVAHRLTDAHNTYLSVAAETGVIGLLTLGGVLAFLLKGLIPLLNNSFDSAIRICLALGLLDAFFYQGLVGSFEDARHMWVLIGLTACVRAGWRDQADLH